MKLGADTREKEPTSRQQEAEVRRKSSSHEPRPYETPPDYKAPTMSQQWKYVRHSLPIPVLLTCRFCVQRLLRSTRRILHDQGAAARFWLLYDTKAVALGGHNAYCWPCPRAMLALAVVPGQAASLKVGLVCWSNPRWQVMNAWNKGDS